MGVDPSQPEFVARHYAERAEAYLHSRDHSTGSDLDEAEALAAEVRPERALDLGCGGGHVSYRLAPHAGQVVACDLTQAMLEVVERTAAARGLGNIGVQQAAAEQLPFPPAHFDLVASRYSAHHWRSLDEGLREARRVLRPGGCGLFMDAVAPADPLLDTHLQAMELLRDPSHVRDYSVAEWAAALGRAGFALQRVTARTLPLRFAQWVERTAAPAAALAALALVRERAPAQVRAAFGLEADGSFTLGTASLLVLAV